MARVALAVVPLMLACKGASNAEVFCGTLSHEREVWVQGGLLASPTSRSLCLSYHAAGPTLTSDDDLGECVFEGEPATGACHTTSGNTQMWVHPTESLEVAYVSELDGGTLTLTGESRTSEYDGSTTVYGIGELRFEGVLDASQSGVSVDEFDLPSCAIPTCQVGAWNVVSWTGHADCEEVVDRNQDAVHEFGLLPETREFLLDDVPTLAHRDVDACAWHVARDGNVYNIWNYTLTDGRIAADQVERWTTTAGEAVTCNIAYEAELEDC